MQTHFENLMWKRWAMSRILPLGTDDYGRLMLSPRVNAQDARNPSQFKSSFYLADPRH